jgi:hypothetical protein
MTNPSSTPRTPGPAARVAGKARDEGTGRLTPLLLFGLPLLLLAISSGAALVWQMTRRNEPAPTRLTSTGETGAESRASWTGSGHAQWPPARASAVDPPGYEAPAGDSSPEGAAGAPEPPLPTEDRSVGAGGAEAGAKRASRAGRSATEQTDSALWTIRHTGPTEASWSKEATQSLRGLAGSLDSTLAGQVTLSEIECYAGGCIVDVRYRDIQAFRRSNEAFLRDPRSPFGHWVGTRRRTPPVVGPDGTVTSTWILAPSSSQAAEPASQPLDDRQGAIPSNGLQSEF